MNLDLATKNDPFSNQHLYSYSFDPPPHTHIRTHSCAYSRDLCLATISTILARLSSKDKHALKLLIPAKFNVEVIVQCIRSPNATRQSNRNALNIVNVAAEVAPKAVLPNVMSIFTFVGQYLLRRDDGFSLQMLEATLDAVVPVLVADSGENATMDLSSAENDHDHGLEVARKLLCVNRNVAHALRVFVDAAPHIPAHRKMTIFKHLMGRLENQNALWSLVVIALEVQVRRAACCRCGGVMGGNGRP